MFVNIKKGKKKQAILIKEAKIKLNKSNKRLLFFCKNNNKKKTFRIVYLSKND